MSEWRWYRSGAIVPVSEDEARRAFDHWKILSDDRGAATFMNAQMWAEIDGLRAEITRLNGVVATMGEALTFYSDDMNYLDRLGIAVFNPELLEGSERAPVLIDDGAMARAALAKAKE